MSSLTRHQSRLYRFDGDLTRTNARTERRRLRQQLHAYLRGWWR